MNPKEIIQKVRITALILSAILLPYSITFCHFFILLFILTSLMERNWKSKIKLLFTDSASLLFILLFVLHLIGILYSADQKNAWFDVEKKIFVFALPIVLIMSSSLMKEEIHRLFNWFMASCIAGTFACFYHAYLAASGSADSFYFNSLTASEFYSSSFSGLWKFFTYGPLASGININPSYFSLYLVFCLLLLLPQHATSFKSYSFTKRISLLVVWVYMSVFVILLSSRMMIIALLLLNGFVSFHYFSERRFWDKLAFTCIVISFLGGLIYLNPVTRYRSEEIMITSNTFQLDTVHTQSVSIRASLWWQGLKAFQSVNPLLGAGTGDVIAAMEESGARHHISNVMSSLDPHNQFLYTLIGLGSIGLLALLSCLLLPAVFALRQRDYFYLGFVLIFTLVCITQSALEFQKGIAFFAIFNSILVFSYCDLQIPSLKQLLHD